VSLLQVLKIPLKFAPLHDILRK